MRMPSVAEDEKMVIQMVQTWIQKLGYQDIRIDECGNIVGALYRSEGATVPYDSHVDTVPAGDEDASTYSPFGCEIVNDRIYDGTRRSALSA